MARTFTVLFHHGDEEYTAVVSQLQDSVCVYIPDRSFHHILPNGRFSYDPEKGLKIDPQSQSPIQNLMLEVLVAIELQTKAQRTDSV
jgi:hypothetical protein